MKNKNKSYYILILFFLLYGCSTKTIVINSTRPSNRAAEVLQSEVNYLSSLTPERCYLSMEELLSDGINWFSYKNDPLCVNRQSMQDIARYANYMLIKIREGDYPWYNHQYRSMVFHKTAWAELFALLSYKTGILNFREWDEQIKLLVAAKQYSNLSKEYTKDVEWVQLSEKLRFLIDNSYNDLDWLKLYLRHWACSNVLAPAKRDSTFYLESQWILLSLVESNNSTFDNYVYSDLDDIQRKMKYFGLNSSLYQVSNPTFIVEDDLTIRETNMQNPQGIALVIGISKYKSQEILPLKYAESGASRIKEMLIKTMGFQESNIIMGAKNGEMTLAELKTAIRASLPSKIHDNQSDVFIYICCHGVPLIELNDAGLVPSDGDPNRTSSDNAYPLSELHSDLEKLNARSLILVLDCCFSGRYGSGTPMIKDSSPAFIVPTGNGFSKKNYIEVSACKKDQVSRWYTEKGHTFFTYFFLKGISGEADSDNNGRLTYVELKEYLENNVHDYVERIKDSPQNPELLGGNLHQVFIDYR